MMHAPFFSVVLFTKNRSQLVGNAVESVLQQSFSDFELIVCDNNDSEETNQVMSQYNDLRIKYHRTNGKLSMIDNWELALSFVSGQYVASMTDRMVFKSYALSRMKAAIDNHSEDVYVYGYDTLNEDMSTGLSSRIRIGAKHKVMPAENIMRRFFHGTYPEYTDYLPKGLNSCCSSALLQEIRISTGGRVCLPVAVDHTLAFLTLAHRSRIVLMHEKLFVWYGSNLSNGVSVARGGETAKSFLRDLRMTEDDLSAEVPIKAVGIHNTVCNDLLRLKRAYPAHCPPLKLDLFYYFIVCRLEIDWFHTPGHHLYEQKVAAWEDALAKQPAALARRVRRSVTQGYPELNQRPRSARIYVMARRVVRKLIRAMHCQDMISPARRVVRALHQQISRVAKSPEPGQASSPRPAAFADVMEALHWIEAHEQE